MRLGAYSGIATGAMKSEALVGLTLGGKSKGAMAAS